MRAFTISAATAALLAGLAMSAGVANAAPAGPHSVQTQGGDLTLVRMMKKKMMKRRMMRRKMSGGMMMKPRMPAGSPGRGGNGAGKL